MDGFGEIVLLVAFSPMEQTNVRNVLKRSFILDVIQIVSAAISVGHFTIQKFQLLL